jgi:hypothetical protein
VEAPNNIDKLRVYFGGVLQVKVRTGRQGAPLLCKVHDEPRQLLTGPEAVAFLEYLANNDLHDLWQKLPTPAETLRAQCEHALRIYQHQIR